MGSYVEINDTLQLTTEQGFPVDIFDIEKHRENPVTLDDVKDKIFSFKNKPSARIFQLDPVRVYYVHNIAGKWLFWGRVFIQSQTAGTYKIIDVYDPDYQERFTTHEAPDDRNFFK